MGGLKVYTASGALKQTGTGSVTATAADVSIVDAGNYYAGAEVETALQELGAEAAGTSTALGGGSFRRSIVLGNQVWQYDDFLAQDGAITTGQTGGLSVGISGAGALVRTAGVVISANHPGQVSLLTGTDTTGSSNLHVGTAQINGLVFSAGKTRLGFWMRVPTISDGTNRFRFRIGFVDDFTDTEASITNSIEFRHRDDVNSGKVEAVKRVASAETAQDTGITPGTGWRYYEIEVTAAGAVTWYIDESSVATTTGAPTSTILSPRIGIYKALGTTARDIHVDAWYLMQNIAR